MSTPPVSTPKEPLHNRLDQVVQQLLTLRTVLLGQANSIAKSGVTEPPPPAPPADLDLQTKVDAIILMVEQCLKAGQWIEANVGYHKGQVPPA